MAITGCISKTPRYTNAPYSAPQGYYTTSAAPTQIIYDYENYNPSTAYTTQEIVMTDDYMMSEGIPTGYVAQDQVISSYAPEMVYMQQTPQVEYVSSSPDMVYVDNPLLPSQKQNLKNVKTIYHRRPRVVSPSLIVDRPGPVPMPTQTVPAPQPVPQVPAPQPSGPEYLVH